MKLLNTMLKATMFALVVIIAGTSCKKTKRPALGDYAKDANPPGGPLKFFAAFNGTSTNPLMNAVDSIRANFPSDNPLVSIAGVTGKGIQGDGNKAIKYPSANDFKGVTSCTIAMWFNNTVNSNTELLFSLTNKDYWHESAAFLLIEHATPTKCQLKFALQDHWVEYIDNFNKPLFDGNWHHLAFTYDETSSTVKVYYDGAEVPLPPGAAGNFAGIGKLTLGNSNNLVVGGWNKHAGLSGPTDGWINGFTGKLDQFRMYGKVLTATEVQALYNSKL